MLGCADCPELQAGAAVSLHVEVQVRLCLSMLVSCHLPVLLAYPLCSCNTTTFLSLQDFQKSIPGCVPAVQRAFQQIRDLFLSGGKDKLPHMAASRQARSGK